MYVLVLTGLPCPDGDCHAHATATAVQSSHADNEDHQAPCSPFCHCATCGGFTIPQPLVGTLPANPPSLLLTRSAFAYQPIQPYDVSSPVWQPPKY
ncbi:hypothetical protein GCM10027423_23180 [Spirosoma arcticum]